MRSPEHVWPGSVERAYAVATVGRQGVRFTGRPAKLDRVQN